MKYTVKEVSSRKEFKRFYQFQNKLYKDCPYYVPSLDIDQKKTLKNAPPLEYCRQKLFLAYCGKRVVGRINAIINPRYNEIHGTRRIRFGWFDFENDIEIARALIKAASDWGRSMGMTEIHGPLGYNTMYKQGMVVEGFDHLPPVNCLYNFEYYPQFMEEMGFVKECDWIQSKITITELPERLERISNMLFERLHLKTMDIKTLKKDKKIVDDFFEKYNTSFSTVYNFIPLTKAEQEGEFKEYITQLSSELNCIVTDQENNVVAFGLSIPNLSRAFQRADGKLFPFGWYHLLHSKRHFESVDMILIGADPKWGNRGVSAIIHSTLLKNYKKLNVRYCISNPQLEDNLAVKIWENYSDVQPYIRRRCYIKSL